MTRLAISVIASASLALFALGHVAGQSIDSNAPTFNRDIAPIIYKRCAGCHRPGQSAPMSLLRYEDARPWAASIKRKIVAREMPPWYADPRFGVFRNNPSLSEKEIDGIVAWIDAGAPRGIDPRPLLPTWYSDGWAHPSGRPPDVVLEMPAEVDVPAEGILPTFNIYSKLPPELSDREHFVEAVQIRPSNLKVVHHSTLSMRSLPAGVTLRTVRFGPNGPVVPGIPVIDDPKLLGGAEREKSAAEVFSTEGASHFLFYLPGNSGFAEFYPGIGKRIHPGDFVEWSIHYAPTGRPEKDREQAGLWLQKVPPTHEMITLRVGDFHIVNGEEIVVPAGVKTFPGHAAIVRIPRTCGNEPCVLDESIIPTIPPHVSNWKITGITPFQDDVTLYLAYPHGHLRLTDMTYVVTYPDGREETIVSVPKFNFAWQLVYEWARPLRMPAGSDVKVLGHYDNSAKNRWNLAPDKEVNWSEQTSDEMFNGYLDLSIDKFDLRSHGPMNQTHQVPIVTTVGCVKKSRQTWLLTNASTSLESSTVHADMAERDRAEQTALGSHTFSLIGTADFGSVEELLTTGQRSQYTNAQTANVSHALVDGRKIAIKALLIRDAHQDRLNLLSVLPVADSCP